MVLPLSSAFTGRMATLPRLQIWVQLPDSQNVDVNLGSKMMLTNSSMFLASCAHQKPFQSALVSAMGKIKEEQTQLTQAPVRRMIVITGRIGGLVSFFRFFRLSQANLLVWMGGRDKEGLYLKYHQKHYNYIIIGFARKKKGILWNFIKQAEIWNRSTNSPKQNSRKVHSETSHFVIHQVKQIKKSPGIQGTGQMCTTPLLYQPMSPLIGLPWNKMHKWIKKSH